MLGGYTQPSSRTSSIYATKSSPHNIAAGADGAWMSVTFQIAGPEINVYIPLQTSRAKKGDAKEAGQGCELRSGRRK
jgi:hypothetical protein